MAACRMAASVAGSGAAAVAARMRTLPSSNACRAVLPPSASSMTSTPPASVGWPLESCAALELQCEAVATNLQLLGGGVAQSVSALGK